MQNILVEDSVASFPPCPYNGQPFRNRVGEGLPTKLELTARTPWKKGSGEPFRSKRGMLAHHPQ